MLVDGTWLKLDCRFMEKKEQFRRALVDQRRLIWAVQDVINRALVPDADISDSDAMASLYTLMEDTELAQQAANSFAQATGGDPRATYNLASLDEQVRRVIAGES